MDRRAIRAIPGNATTQALSYDKPHTRPYCHAALIGLLEFYMSKVYIMDLLKQVLRLEEEWSMRWLRSHMQDLHLHNLKFLYYSFSQKQNVYS
jgi:hypothetical protein